MNLVNTHSTHSAIFRIREQQSSLSVKFDHNPVPDRPSFHTYNCTVDIFILEDIEKFSQ